MICFITDGSDTTSHTNTFELFGSTKESHLYPMSPSEDARSYDTYDKSLDEFSDECSKNYEVSLSIMSVAFNNFIVLFKLVYILSSFIIYMQFFLNSICQEL